MIERTIQVWIGNDYLEVPYEIFDEELDEDEMYEAAVAYVMNNISIDLI